MHYTRLPIHTPSLSLSTLVCICYVSASPNLVQCIFFKVFFVQLTIAYVVPCKRKRKGLFTTRSIDLRSLTVFVSSTNPTVVPTSHSVNDINYFNPVPIPLNCSNFCVSFIVKPCRTSYVACVACLCSLEFCISACIFVSSACFSDP